MSMNPFSTPFFAQSWRQKKLMQYLLPASVFAVELFAFLVLTDWDAGLGLNDLWPLAFAALWALVLSAFLWLLPKTVARICYGAFYYLSLLYAAFQTGYYLLFGQMMWLSDFRYADEGADYASVLLGYPIGWWLGLLILAALGVFLLWKFPDWYHTRWEMKCAASLMALAVVALLALPQLVFFCDYRALQKGSEADQLAAGDYGRMQSAEAAYKNLFNAHRLYQVCGLNQMFCKDLYAHGIYPMTPGYLHAQREAKEQLRQYLPGHAANDMTGLLAGKDVILVLMESVDDWMIGNHTPTICRLMEEGINFTQFYTPAYGGVRTFNTEFCINTGSFLSSQGGYAFDYVTNHFDQSFAFRLREQGYSAKLFHYNDPAFYSREEFAPALGYEEYVYFRDYVTEEEWQQQQYDDTLLFQNDALCDEFFREGQNFNFVITRSAHLGYQYNEVLSWWGLQKYPQYYEETDREETNCALLKARLVDDMFAALLEELEARGRLENTVIIGITDHYTYGYRHEDGTTDIETLMELSDVDHELLLEKTPCFIWSADLQPMEVDKTLNTSDLLPTLMNLLGVESSYCYLGRDAFDPGYDGFVPFSNGSWIAGDTAYDSGKKSYISISGNQQTVTAETQKAMGEKVQEFIRINNLILESDFYG